MVALVIWHPRVLGAAQGSVTLIPPMGKPNRIEVLHHLQFIYST
jgi:hypothetical protein